LPVKGYFKRIFYFKASMLLLYLNLVYARARDAWDNFKNKHIFNHEIT